MFVGDETEGGSPSFPTTVWTEIARARHAGGSRDRELALAALSRLVERYWHPVYFFVRHKGRGRDEAKDLTQEFFTSFLERDIVSYADQTRGKFRTFLLHAVCRFLALEGEAAARRPRRRPSLAPWRDPTGWAGFEPADTRTPEDVFMRNWAKSFLESCVVKLRRECERLNKHMQFRVFQLRVLAEEPVRTRVAAIELGITVTDVVNYLRRAKGRFRRIVREEMSSWVAAPDRVDEEIEGLLRLLSS